MEDDTVHGKEARHALWLRGLQMLTQDLQVEQLKIYREILETMLSDERTWLLLIHCKTFSEVKVATTLLYNYVCMLAIDQDDEMLHDIDLEACVKSLFILCPMIREAVQDGYSEE